MGALKFFLQRSFMMRRIHLARSQIFEWQSFAMNVVASLGDIHHKVTLKFLIGSAEVFMMSSELLSDNNNLSYRMNESDTPAANMYRYVKHSPIISLPPKNVILLSAPNYLSFVLLPQTIFIQLRVVVTHQGKDLWPLPHFLNIRKT